MNDKFLIHVEIADKSYGLWIRRDEELIVREAAKQLRKKVYQYRQKYTKSDLDIKDLLAMVALQLSIQKLQLEDKNDTDPFTEKIQQLTSELEMYLEGK
ncbi:cell division protein ZapA [Parabacteroides sp. OttesenSCG-928-G06]|nr:cell division protein ZapA [Parabacteroides sp. OttesenSCG-928-G06]